MTTPAGIAEPNPSYRRALAAQMRLLAAAVMLTRADEAAMARALDRLVEAAAEIDGEARTGRYEGVAGLAPGPDPSNDAVWETHAMFGPCNPLAPPVTVQEGAGRIDAEVTFGAAYEGGPGSVYGGSIAAAFDAVLGRAVISSGRLGVTRSLTVRYLRPTPLRVPLRLVSEIGAVTGRDVLVRGRLWNDGTVTCEAEAVFTCVEPERYRL